MTLEISRSCITFEEIVMVRNTQKLGITLEDIMMVSNIQKFYNITRNHLPAKCYKAVRCITLHFSELS